MPRPRAVERHVRLLKRRGFVYLLVSFTPRLLARCKVNFETRNRFSGLECAEWLRLDEKTAKTVRETR